MNIQSTIKTQLEKKPAPVALPEDHTQSPPAVTKPDEPRISDALKESIRKSLSFSAIVYDSLPYAEAQLKDFGYDHVTSASRWWCSGVQVICGIKDRQAYISFRGSASLLDWFIDFLIIPFFWMPRHIGFGYAWLTIRGKIHRWLKDNQEHFDDILLTGHSLGGAMAHNAAFSVAKNHKIANVITFGAPKSFFIGTHTAYKNTKIKNSEHALNDVTHIVVNQRDIVAKVPLALMGYCEVGHLIYIDYKDNVHVGKDAYNARMGDSTGDIDYLNSFLEDEQQSTYGMDVLANPNETLMDKVRKVLKKAGTVFPYTRFPIAAIFLYFIMCFYFMRSGLAHMTDQYISVFFGDEIILDFNRETPSLYKRIKARITQIILGVVGLGVFLIGLYYIALWFVVPVFLSFFWQ